MEAYVKKALDYHHSGYNCAQSVVCTFADALGLDEVSLYTQMLAFGSGMGDTKDTCGAVSGFVALAGLRQADGTIPPISCKKEVYQLVAAMKDRFKEKNQTTICRELKGMDTGKPIRSCDGCIEDAVRIAAEMLGLEKEKKE